MRRWGRWLAALGILLLLALPALAEEAPEASPAPSDDAVSAPEEQGFDELDEIELGGPQPEPSATQAPTSPPGTPVPTLEPGSLNYPKDKVNFEGEIWRYLTDGWGLSNYHAAAVMGNMICESGFSPYSAERSDGVDNRRDYSYDVNDHEGFGLCQWTSTSEKKGLRDYAVSMGDENLVWDFDVQMGFLRKDMDWEAFQATDSLYAATEWFVLRYERPNLRYSNSWPGTRYRYALAIYRNHTGHDYNEPPLRFSVRMDGVDVLKEGCSLPSHSGMGPEATLIVDCNYYWRLVQVDSTVDGWLEPRGYQIYRPDSIGGCSCGYVCEPEKPVWLCVRKAPPAGETYSTTLRFEIYRGKGVARRVYVRLARTGDGEALPREVIDALGRFGIRLGAPWLPYAAPALPGAATAALGLAVYAATAAPGL